MKGRGQIARSLEAFKARKNYDFMQRLTAATQLKLKIHPLEHDNPGLVMDNLDEVSFDSLFSDFLTTTERDEIRAWLKAPLKSEIVEEALTSCILEESQLELDCNLLAQDLSVKTPEDFNSLEKIVVCVAEVLPSETLHQIECDTVLDNTLQEFLEETECSVTVDVPVMDEFGEYYHREIKTYTSPARYSGVKSIPKRDVVKLYPGLTLKILGRKNWSLLMFRAIVASLHFIPWQVRNGLLQRILHASKLFIPYVVQANSLTHLSLTKVLEGRVALLQELLTLTPHNEAYLGLVSWNEIQTCVVESLTRIIA